jgi:deferrochelatase/peroxidase EfeB
MGAVSRRRFLAAMGVAGGAAVGAGGVELLHARRLEGQPDRRATVPFAGTHQAGIVTPMQSHLCFGTFDVATTDREALVDLLRRWSDAARQLSEGLVAADDSAETDGLFPARLTITFGFGPTLFDTQGVDRFGLRERRPRPLVEIPPMPGDALEAAASGGDIGIQACADDPFVARHAIRTMARLAGRDALLRWRQTGFGPTATTSRQQPTPRNLMGHKDGTNNIRLEDRETLDREVWAGDDDLPWMRGGTYLVARRIRMLLEPWDRTPEQRQNEIIGRDRQRGAPLGGHQEHDPVDLAARGTDGRPLIPANAHIRLAAPSVNNGARLLRRGYSFDDGVDLNGHMDAGLFFICFQRDPRRQFIPMQQRLASHDALNGFIQHRASAVFACPGGAGDTGWVGQALFA